jgi:hypothetical protein
MKDDFNFGSIILFFLAPITASIGFSKYYFSDKDVLNQTINIFVIYLLFLFIFFIILTIVQLFDIDIETNKFMTFFITIISHVLNYLIVYGTLLAGIDTAITLYNIFI